MNYSFIYFFTIIPTYIYLSHYFCTILFNFFFVLIHFSRIIL
jgi:hypothetical protein